VNSPLDWFGLPPQADEREIKRAYAKRLKAVRPDVDPAGFQELHEMYRRALAWRAHAATVVMATADEDEDTGQPEDAEETAARAPVAETPAPAPAPDPHGAWHPPRFEQPPAGPAPAPPRFDLQAFIEAYMKVAPLGQSGQLKSWLHEQPALWSLQTKQNAGRALIQRLLGEVPPIDAASMDATLDFFDLDHTQSGIDALHLHQLRGMANERYELVQRHAPTMQAWGADPQRLDLGACFDWLREQALEGDRGVLEAALCVQPALRNFAVRQAAARPLFERLWLERPPMPASCAWLLIQFFGLRPLLAQAGQAPQDFAARLEIAWLMLERNKNALASVTKDPKKPYAMPNQSWQELQRLRQPFRWWWIVLCALIPYRISAMGRFALRLCGGNLPLLDGFFDPRLTRFCIGAAERFLVTRPRVIVGAVRCLVLLLAGTLLYVLVEPPGDREAFPILPGIATAAWVYYLVFLVAWRWQQQPEQPVTPRPLLRMAFVPLLALGALAIYSFGRTGNGQPLLFPALLLAVPAFALGYLRWRARNPGKPSFLSKLPDTVVGLLVLIGAAMLLSDARVPAAGALVFWMLDMFKQRKRLRWRV